MKALENKKHFVTNALVMHQGKRKECRLSIDLDKKSNGYFLITEMAIHTVIRQYEFADYNGALNHYRKLLEKWL